MRICMPRSGARQDPPLERRRRVVWVTDRCSADQQYARTPLPKQGVHDLDVGAATRAVAERAGLDAIRGLVLRAAPPDRAAVVLHVRARQDRVVARETRGRLRAGDPIGRVGYT